MAKKKTTLAVGDKVKVIGNTSGHGAAIGVLATISPVNAGSGYHRLIEYPNWNFAIADLEKIPTSFSKSSIEKEKAELLAKVAVLDTKLAFLAEIESDEADDTEFRVFSTLTLVENGNLSKREKAQAIAALLSEK